MKYVVRLISKFTYIKKYLLKYINFLKESLFFKESIYEEKKIVCSFQVEKCRRYKLK